MLDELKYIFEQIEDGNIWTIVDFEIPYFIDLLDNKEYTFVYNEVNCKVKSRRIASNRGIRCDNGYVFNKNDKYGLLNYSKIRISINEYIDPKGKMDVNRELKDVWKSVAKAIEIWNYFLKIFKIVTKEYWLDSINELMILNYCTYIYAGEKEIRNIPLSFSLGLQINSECPHMIQKNDKLQIKDIADSIGVSRTTVLREIQEIKKTESLCYDKKEKRRIFL